MAQLRLENIHKRYGDVHAIRGVTLDIADGEFTVLLGPSGCGKSTLLRVIAGLEDADEGSILIDGQAVDDVRAKDRDIAMVFQNYALYPYMTVYENIAFGMRMRKLPPEEIRQQVAWAARMLEIDELLERWPRQLSGGQRQRVAMGRAMVRKPRLFLFDEPLSNLDAQLRDGMRTEIKQLHQTLGITTIYVTHDQIEAMMLADRVVLLNRGVIEQQGAPMDLYGRPSNRFVATFVGSPPINYIDGQVRVVDGIAQMVLSDGSSIALAGPRGVAIGAGGPRPLTLGVRPEHFLVADGGSGAIGSRVTLVQPAGARVFVNFPIAGTSMMGEFSARQRFSPGQELALELDIERIVLLDPDTGRAVDA
jgi:multiple sugar transport system ATP-binding protein